MSYQGTVHTRILKPTKRYGVRVKATSYSGSVTLPWDPTRSVKDNHLAAVQELAQSYGWFGAIHLRMAPKGTYIAVFVEQHDTGYPSLARSSENASYRGVFIVRESRNHYSVVIGESRHACGTVESAKAWIDAYVEKSEET